MDLGEFIFEKIAHWISDNNESKIKQHEYVLSSCEKTLGLLIPYYLDGWAEVRAAKMAGVRGSSFYFPPSISFFKNVDLNRALYIHLGLILTASKKINITYPTYADSPFIRAYYLSQVLPFINSNIDQTFPGFKKFQKDLLQNIWSENLSDIATSKNTAILIDEFKESFLKRSDLPINNMAIKQKIETALLRNKNILKQNENVPDFINTIWGNLDIESENSTSNHVPELKTNRPKNKSKSYSDNKEVILTSYEMENVDLEKEQKRENPVTHSFEKLETIDEYDGGYRTTDGSDQLEEHQAALQDINIKKVTRGGEASESFLKTDSSGSSFTFDNEFINEVTDEIFLYPEYNYKTKKHQENYCRLMQTPSMKDFNHEDGVLLQEKIKTDYNKQIKYFQSLFDQIFNQKKWVNKQWDGPEVDIDSLIRHLTDTKNKSSSSLGQFYLNQKKQAQDFEMMILIDNSLSTDSYVNNRRVLDVAIESVGIMGLLLKNTFSRITIASTCSESRNNCEFRIIKGPEESWNTFFIQANEVSPKGYTRLGPGLRHSVKILKESQSQKKIIILLTDGKPTDIDGYEGRYGIEDMRQAVLSAQSHGIYVKAFTIENEAKHYFPHMFGNYEILSSPELLPKALLKTYVDALSAR